MRQKRAKAYRKLMALYSMSFGFRQPYQVLVDSEMCKFAIESKTELANQLAVILQGTVKPMITQCCIHELYLLGKTQQNAVDLAKSFERRKCNHREAIPGEECLTSVVGDSNKHRYVIATQSQPLRVKLRNIPAVPIIHANRSVMVLEPPSDATLKVKESIEEKGLHATGSDMAVIPAVEVPAAASRKKKGPKGPNPLSVKKKKPKDGARPTRTDEGKVKDERPSFNGNEESKAGEKRSRDTNDPADDRGEGGHKRKRRRKGTSMNASDVVQP